MLETQAKEELKKRVKLRYEYKKRRTRFMSDILHFECVYEAYLMLRQAKNEKEKSSVTSWLKRSNFFDDIADWEEYYGWSKPDAMFFGIVVAKEPTYEFLLANKPDPSELENPLSFLTKKKPSDSEEEEEEETNLPEEKSD